MQGSFYLGEPLLFPKSMVKENKPIGEDYTYENPNHLTYCDLWKDEDANPVGSVTKVNHDLTVFGVERKNINLVDKDDPSNECAAISLDHIPSDRVVVVPTTNNNSVVSELGENFLFSKNVKTIYLPKSIKTIRENNFFCCSLLKPINFEGNEEEWNAINNLSIDNIADDVIINFETTFTA